MLPPAGTIAPPHLHSTAMRRDELITRTRQLIDEGERLVERPSIAGLRTWLQLSDELLSQAWGSMDRYHLAWLMVGKPREIVRGRVMTPDEEAAYVREVARQKTAALRTSLDAVERQGMPFRGETGGVGPGQRQGSVPAGDQEPRIDDAAVAERHAHLAQGSRRSIPLDPELQQRLDQTRRRAAEHAGHERRAPRPDRLQR